MILMWFYRYYEYINLSIYFYLFIHLFAVSIIFWKFYQAYRILNDQYRFGNFSICSGSHKNNALKIFYS